VDETGEVIWGDKLMILFSRALLKDKPGATILGEVKCSQTLYDDIAKHGGKPIIWKTGHSLIKAKMRETGALLAGEMSGHLFFKERWYGFDDAIYAGARLMEVVSREIRNSSSAEIFSAIPDSVNTPELQIPVTEQNKFTIIE